MTATISPSGGAQAGSPAGSPPVQETPARALEPAGDGAPPARSPEPPGTPAVRTAGALGPALGSPAAGGHRSVVPVEPASHRLRQFLLRRGDPGRDQRLDRAAVRVPRRRQRHHGGQAAGRPLDPGPRGTDLRLLGTEHAHSPGTHGSGRRRAPLPDRQARVRTGGGPPRRRRPGADPRGRPHVPVQQPGRHAHPVPRAGRLPHHPRHREGRLEMARRGRRGDRPGLPDQDAAGLPDRARAGPGLPVGGARHPRPPAPAPAGRRRRNRGRGRKLPGAVPTDPGLGPPLHGRLGDQQLPGTHVRLQRPGPDHRVRRRHTRRRHSEATSEATPAARAATAT